MIAGYDNKKELKWQQLPLPRIIDDKYAKRDEQLLFVMQQARSLFASKNRQYRDAIVRTGVLGASVEMVGIAARLEALVIQAENITSLSDRDIRNALMDAIVYGAIGIMMLNEGNIRGK